MADYAEIEAERRQLEAELYRLEGEIEAAIALHEELKEEREYVIDQADMLNTYAHSMGQSVNNDLTSLNKRIENRAVDARDLLQLLRDVSERYFTYKNLSTATKNLTQYTDQYHTRFAFYHELRRIALGCVMAVDTHLISQETTRKQAERAYLANTDYWLSYALMAVMLWWSNEREAAGRAMKRALMMSERKSSLFFLFCNLKFGRKQVALKWYMYYLNAIHADNVGEEFQYLLEAHLSGAFGSDRTLATQVASKINDMVDEITVHNIDFDTEVADAMTRFLATKAHTTDFEFFYLPEYCTQSGDMKSLLSDAEKNVVVAREYQEIAQEPENDRDVKERLEDSIYNLIESMDPQEEQLHRRIRYNELIVAAKGDVHQAEQAYAERYPETGPVGFDGLLKKWAFTEDDPAILPQIRSFAIEKLLSGIRAGAKRFADGYRSREQERYTISVDGWTGTVNENEISIAKANFEAFFKKHSIWEYLKDKFVLIWIGMIVAGILGLVISAVAWLNPTPIVISVLLVLVGAFCLWRQIANLQQVFLIRKRKDLEIIERTLAEMGAWREAYRNADKGLSALMDALDLFTDSGTPVKNTTASQR
ncbi:hypothetical protein JS530_00740 [Bifidobacterium sp. LC6]|uniref:Uncharacterized protein n=1 Tax=Bifidobacterium colobi TaxID=2809026 RepID=A0ABS5UUC0_9BIFI|nr:hypothetical protein [Bifidobacterium colobi]MBT1174058.1 hypothetical protein [Bifidobacterium colobi]